MVGVKNNVWDAGAVALGGAVGASLRFGMLAALPYADWPVATFVTNVVGSFILGYLTEALFTGAHPRLKLLLGTGLLGGFTTYSTFMVETLHLPLVGALTYVAATIILGLGAARIGLELGQRRRMLLEERR